ncbi:hypothetical protein Tco_0506796 [Tanacetum coccineum]
MELEPEIRILDLECNMSLSEGVPFVNNMVIEEREYEMFFIDVFSDEAFQRISDVNKVGVETLLTYLVMALNITTLENTRFCLKLRKLISYHPDQEKLKKGGSYSVVAPRLEPGKFNKWKKRMLYYLTGMDPYYIQCIKDGPFKPKIDDIMESVISCETAKDTWTDLVHSFEGPSDTKKNRIMDSKLEYQTFRSKSSKTLSQTYTRYKTPLNELADDGVTLSKHKINVGFVNSLLEKWISSLRDLAMQIRLRPLT